MKLYVCLDTIIKKPQVIEQIKKYFHEGYKITIACTQKFRAENSREEIEKMLLPLENCYHVLSFLKPEYDRIIDIKSESIQSSNY